MKLGILESITFVGTLAVAIPMVYAGGSLYLSGEPIGLLFVGLGVLLVVAEHVLTTPQDLPFVAVEKIAGGVLPDPEESETNDEE